MDKAVVKARAKLDDATDSLTSRNKPCPLSFAPGTQVATPEGLVAIESLKVGDLVMSKNDVTGEVEARAVLATIETRHEHDVRLLTVKTMLGEEMVIVTSDEHPFYVSGAGWVEAGDLSVGDFLFTLAEKNLELLGSERLDDSMLMYNLTVDEFHTYSVTEEEVWVHNCKKVNGNSKASTNHQHGYEIVDTKTGKVAKTGVSGGKLNLDGSSRRANSQANKWNKEPNNAGRYEARVVVEVPSGPGAREEILKWERDNADFLRLELDPARHSRP